MNRQLTSTDLPHSAADAVTVSQAESVLRQIARRNGHRIKKHRSRVMKVHYGIPSRRIPTITIKQIEKENITNE